MSILKNSLYLMSNNLPSSVFCLILTGVVVISIIVCTRMFNIKSGLFLSVVVPVIFLFGFISSTAMLGSIERIKDGLEEHICNNIYTNSRYDDNNKQCYVRIIAKNGRTLELEITNNKFTILPIDANEAEDAGL